MDIKLKDNSKLKLSPFTQLEYIESTGTQYIQTNFSLNLSNKVFCKIKENVHNSNGGVPFAATWESNKMFYLQYYNDIKFCYYNNSYTVQSVDTNVHEFTLNDNGKYYIDGVEKGTVTQQNINLQNFRIFDIYVPNSSTNFKFTGRIYFIEIYDGATLLHNFIPVKDSNNVVCMYDTVSKTFFYNQGTGDFIAGPPPIKPVLPENILLKTTTLYHKNTPNVNGLQFLNNILNYQKTHQDEIILLNRIRVDIGNVSGSISELLQYANMAGFNDNYEPQDKPRLVGTWTINDWYTTAQLALAQSTFDGLTIVENPNYVLDFTQMAVQVLDPNEDNYNPAVAIILQGQNIGTTTISAPLGHGRWFLTKAQAAAITDISNWFTSKVSVTDTAGIVSSDTTQTYDFESFDEFEYFTGVTAIGVSGRANYGFSRCTALTSIKIPQNVTNIYGTTHNAYYSAFRGCTTLSSIVILSNGITCQGMVCFAECTSLVTLDASSFTSLGSSDTFNSCTNLESIILNQALTSIPQRCFEGCSKLNITSLPDTITSIGADCFNGCTSLQLTGLPSGVTSIPDALNERSTGCFQNCKALTDFSLPANLNHIGVRAFIGCSNLQNITLTDNITVIKQETFYGCSNLKVNQIPQTITSIGENAFNGAGSNITVASNEYIDVNLPNLTSVGSGAFGNTSKQIKRFLSLGSITTIPYRYTFSGVPNCEFMDIPATVTSIDGSYAYGISLSNNAIIHCNPTTPPSIGRSSFGAVAKIYVGSGNSATDDNTILQAYLADSTWSTYYSSKLDTWYNYLHPAS